MRLIDADALIEKWYEVNNIGPEDRGARFIGYTEIPRFINNAPTVEPTGDLISRAEAVEAVCRTRCGDKAKGCPAHSCFVIEEFDALPSAELPKGELISRADAIEVVRKKLQDWGSYAFEDYRRGLYEAQDIIEALPSADAEPTETSTLGEKHQLLHGRLIDADELKKHLDGAWEELNDDGERKGVRLARWYLISAPTVDTTIDLVRCKDCIQKHIGGNVTHYYWCDLWDREVNETDYCAWGERRKNVQGRMLRDVQVEHV